MSLLTMASRRRRAGGALSLSQQVQAALAGKSGIYLDSSSITGMWQVNGRSGSSFADYQRLDLYYVDNWSILVDVGILAKTLPAVLSSRGAM